MSAWIVSKQHIDAIVEGAIRLGLIAQADSIKTGRMLTNANKKSIRSRYGWDDREAASVKTYSRFDPPREPLSLPSLLKQLHCYDYQTCEIWEYEKTTAYRFVQRMERALSAQGITRKSPGYNEAPWGI